MYFETCSRRNEIINQMPHWHAKNATHSHTHTYTNALIEFRVGSTNGTLRLFGGFGIWCCCCRRCRRWCRYLRFTFCFVVVAVCGSRWFMPHAATQERNGTASRPKHLNSAAASYSGRRHRESSHHSAAVTINVNDAVTSLPNDYSQVMQEIFRLRRCPDAIPSSKSTGSSQQVQSPGRQ